MSRSLKNLARAIGRRCRGRTLVHPEIEQQILERLESRLEVVTGAPVATQGSSGAQEPIASRFDTAVLAGVLERSTPEATPSLLRQFWERLTLDGRLVVCVPNESCSADDAFLQRFRRRDLKRLLASLGRPRLATDQPFGWILMYVDRHPLPGPAVRERYRVVARLCRGQVLELGCGRGRLCRAIADRGLSVAGIDKNAAKIEAACELYPEIPFAQADALDLNEDKRHDTVVLAEVLEHMTEEIGDRVLAKAWDLVAPGGRLIVSVPNEDCVPHRNHVREFDRRGLRNLLRTMGRPHVVTDQPYKWLLMYVDRPD